MGGTTITPVSEKVPVVEGIDINKFRNLLTMFQEYFTGRTNGSSEALNKLLRFYTNLEELIFGEKQTSSWSFGI